MVGNGGERVLKNIADCRLWSTRDEEMRGSITMDFVEETARHSKILGMLKCHRGWRGDVVGMSVELEGGVLSIVWP